MAIKILMDHFHDVDLEAEMFNSDGALAIMANGHDIIHLQVFDGVVRVWPLVPTNVKGRRPHYDIPYRKDSD